MDLSECQVTVMLPVKDVSRASRFYEGGLALKDGVERPDGKVVYHCGGTEIALFLLGRHDQSLHFSERDLSEEGSNPMGLPVIDLPGARLVLKCRKRKNAAHDHRAML